MTAGWVASVAATGGWLGAALAVVNGETGGTIAAVWVGRGEGCNIVHEVRETANRTTAVNRTCDFRNTKGRLIMGPSSFCRARDKPVDSVLLSYHNMVL